MLAPEARRRVREATLDVVSERGYEGTTMVEVAARAGIDPAELDRSFTSKEDLYLEIFDEISAEFDRLMDQAYASEEDWRDALRACAYAAARYLRDHPREVEFGSLRMFAAGELAQVHRDRQLQRMVDLIDRGREELDDPASVGRGVAEGVMGSIYGLLVRELQSGEGVEAGEGFVPELMYIAVRPYLGHEVAREELSIPPPPESNDASP